MADSRTKFEVSSVSHCGEITKPVNWPRPRPFQGRFFISRVGLAIASQCTKFEVSRFTRCEAMAVQNTENEVVWVVRGHSRSWAMPPFDRARTTSYSTIVQTISVYLSQFSRYIAGYLSKVADFDPPHLLLAPP